MGKSFSLAFLRALVESEVIRVLQSVKDRSSKEGLTVFTMMMVKRDHGQRYNAFDYLYDRYPMVVQKLNGYTYELAEIEKALKLELSGGLDLSTLKRVEDLERRLAALPKPDDFESRPPESTGGQSIKAVRL